MSAEAVAELGFELVQRRRDGSSQYTLRANPYLVFWLTADAGGGAVLTWEFALGEYLVAKGLSLSAQDALSLLLFPATDARGTFDGVWVADEVDRVLERLRSVDLASGA